MARRLESPLDPPPSLEEHLRPLRDRFRFLESLFAIQQGTATALSATAMSPEGLAGLTEICRSAADVLGDLIAHLPGPVINAAVRGVQPLSLRPRRARHRERDEPA